ncbi:MAG TPA: hypothetical protein VEY91_12045, partial [Candidatus Limnocylindria bacterium]|nr:hypothetical protein [Candidatus Limnocylindria bacterium]
MVKPAFGLVGLLATLMAAGRLGDGCGDLRRSLTDLAYPPYRDMRRTVVLNPQKVVTRAPDSSSVPIGGREIE